MDAAVKKSCSSCSQFFSITSFSPKLLGRIPLLLSCGHSLCETCIKNIIKAAEPIICGACGSKMELSNDQRLLSDINNLRNIFPVNLYMLGQLTLQLSVSDTIDPGYFDGYIDLHNILKENHFDKFNCVECQQSTFHMCKQCDNILCKSCFDKIHKNFQSLKNHSLTKIEVNNPDETCQTHKDKSLGYFCVDCSKAICMDCTIIGGDKSCKSHSVIAASEKNAELIEELKILQPKVDEVFRRLTYTATKVGGLLQSQNKNLMSDLSEIDMKVHLDFGKTIALLQMQETLLTNKLDALKMSEKHSLLKTRSEVKENLKKVKLILDRIAVVLCSDTKHNNIYTSLLEQAKEAIDIPWYLYKDVENKSTIKLQIKEEVSTMLTDFINLEGSDISQYSLLPTKMIKDDIPPAPEQPVFPPTLLIDVRENMSVPKAPSQKAFVTKTPSYRNKSSSLASLNSNDSDQSGNKHTRFTMEGEHQSPVIHKVTPFKDSIQPKALREGSQELIYVTHIVDPHNFFVQRACYQDLVKDMMKQFRNPSSLPKPSITQVHEGKIFLAYNHTDNQWHRCRIVSINRKNMETPVYQVFCIDFGQFDHVTVEKLRMLPSAGFQTPPPLAIQCSLANCMPYAGVWSPEDIVLMQKIIDNKQAVMYIHRVASSNNYVTVQCDLTTLEHGVNLTQAFIFHERARIRNPHILMPPIQGLAEKPQLFYGQSDYKPNTVEQVRITYVISPDKFYVRKAYFQEDYEKLLRELDETYSLRVTNGTVYCPQPNMLCVANMDKYSEQVFDGGWRRAVVKETPGRLRVKVILPDSGESVLVHYTSLRHIHNKFTKLKALAVECHLTGVIPLNRKWSNASVALLNSFMERVLNAQVDKANKTWGSLGVTLYDNTDEDNKICINSEMIHSKFAIPIVPFMFNTRGLPEKQNTSVLIPDEKSKSQPKPQKNKITIQKKGKALKNTSDNDLEGKDKGPIKLEVKVLSCQSPSLIYVALHNQLSNYKDMFENLEKYCKNTKASRDNWKVGDRCAALAENKYWRRGVIANIEEGYAKVFYNDYASIEKIQISELKPLHNEFIKDPDAAIKCHLTGVMSADSKEWATITTEYLKELISSYDRIFITKNGVIKEDKSLPVEIWVYHVDQGGALEPDRGEWRCLNYKLIEQGLAVPDRTQKEETSESDSAKGSDNISFFNVTGNILEWLQLEPREKKVPKHDEHSSSDSEQGKIVKKNQPEPPMRIITDWPPPEPFTSSEVIATPTYVDENGIIYLHDVTQEETLELIRKALDVKFKHSEAKAQDSYWSVDQPCIARFYLDNLFYRGKVLAINNDTCVIYYVDYGNEELCSVHNMRKNLIMTHIPVQAHKCVLSGIKPIHDQWDKQTLDYIHKLVVEKKCLIKVSGPKIRDVIPIELKYDKIWLKDHLVDLEMAEYTDSSKKKVSPKKRLRDISPSVDTDESILLDNGSGPDYIIDEDDQPSLSSVSKDNSIHAGTIDWNKLVCEDESPHEDDETCLTYRLKVLPRKEEFVCNVSCINGKNDMELIPIDDDDEKYEVLFAKLQEIGSRMPFINGVYENKACIALFSEDEKWYRAAVLQFDEDNDLVKVRYVDFGNTEILPKAMVREISEELCLLPPAAKSARLHNITVNPTIEMSKLTEEYEKTFLNKPPILVKIMDADASYIYVELRSEINGPLIYQHLIDNGTFVKK